MTTVLEPLTAVSPIERRRSPRVRHEQACKLYRPSDDRFVAGVTCDLSDGGVMVRLNQHLPIVPGETVRVGMGPRRSDGFLLVREMVEADVLRSVSFDGHTTLALRYRRSEPLRSDGLRLAA